MIVTTSKGESYMGRIETPENEEESLLKAIVDIGVPVSIYELHRMTKLSTNQCEKLAKRLRKHGMVEITPDSFAGKAMSVAARGIGNIAKGTQHMSGEKLKRLAFGNTQAVLGFQRKLPTEEQRREQREVLRERRPRI